MYLFPSVKLYLDTQAYKCGHIYECTFTCGLLENMYVPRALLSVTLERVCLGAVYNSQDTEET